jgi:hypothetical protein
MHKVEIWINGSIKPTGSALIQDEKFTYSLGEHGGDYLSPQDPALP